MKRHNDCAACAVQRERMHYAASELRKMRHNGKGPLPGYLRAIRVAAARIKECEGVIVLPDSTGAGA